MTDPAPTAARPLRLGLAASPALAALIAAIHLAGASALLTVLTGWEGVALAALLLLLGGYAAWDRALLHSARSPRTLEIQPDGTAKCLFANGKSVALERLGSGLVTRHWVALRLHSRWRRSLFVAAGMLRPEDFRRLRLWALWGRWPIPAPRPAQRDGV